MKNKISAIKRITCVLGILFIMLGLLPVATLSRVGAVFAKDDAEPTQGAPSEEPADPPPADPPADPPPADPTVEPSAEEQTVEFTILAAMEGPDLDGKDGTTRDKLPEAKGEADPNKYTQGLCSKFKDSICDSITNITQPQSPTWEWEYTLLRNETIVAINLQGGGTDDWMFFEKGAGRSCPSGTNYCVEWISDSQVKIYGSNILCEPVGNSGKIQCTGPNQIDFWKPCPAAGTCPDTCGYRGSSDQVPDGKCGYKTCLAITPPAEGTCPGTCGYEGSTDVIPNGVCGYKDCPEVPIIDCKWKWSEWVEKDECVWERTREIYEPANDCGDCEVGANSETLYLPDEEEVCPTDCGQKESWVSDGDCGLKYCAPTKSCGGGGGGGGGGGVGGAGGPVEAVIPVTGEEVLIIPVTGVDFGFDYAGLKQGFLFTGLMLFGLTLLLEGTSRKYRV